VNIAFAARPGSRG